MRTIVLPALGTVLLMALGACEPTSLTMYDTLSDADVTLGVEPSMRDPLGYSSLPVDTDVYTTELDGEGLPGPGEMVEMGAER